MSAVIRWRLLFVIVGLVTLAGCQTLGGHDQQALDEDEVATTNGPAPEDVPPLKPEGETLTETAKHPKSQGPSEPLSLWNRIQSRLTISIPDNADINKARKRYLRHPELLYTISDRAEPFLYHIVEYIQDKDMPMELVLLPFVESGFDPYAYSSGGAVGLWQFMPATARQLGLRIDWWYDGRRDVLASTEMALTYLQYLADRFDGDWLLAIAAYNAGEGRVGNAIAYNRKHGRPTDFWHLRLPRETRQYVPRLLALSQIVRHPEHYDLELPDVPNKAETELVDVSGQIDLTLAAKLADVDLGTFHQLNPGYNRWATPPNGPQSLLLPAEAASAFKTALAKLPSDERVSWIRYKVRRGDSLSEIAQRYHTTVAVIKKANKLPSTVIRVGHPLLIPRGATTDVPDRMGPQQQFTYTVRSGDSLWDIGRRFGVSFHQLAKWNNLDTTAILQPGDHLTIYSGKQQKARSSKHVKVTVRKGETLSHIAHRFRVSVQSLLKWNDLSLDDYLQPGQKINVYVNTSEG